MAVVVVMSLHVTRQPVFPDCSELLSHHSQARDPDPEQVVFAFLCSCDNFRLR